MVELQKILPVTKVKRELLDIIKAMEEEYATITVIHAIFSLRHLSPVLCTLSSVLCPPSSVVPHLPSSLVHRPSLSLPL